MADIDYMGLLKKSWDDFRNNLILIVPLLINIGLMLGIIVVIALEGAIFYLIFSNQILTDPTVLLSFTGIFLAVFFMKIVFQYQ